MDLPEAAAAVAIVRARVPSDSILLIRRSVRKDDPWSGHWAFPGGRRDPDDPDLLHTALRELEEECGIRLEREQMEAALPLVFARRRTGPFLLVAPFVFAIEGELPTQVDHQEAVEALWMLSSVWFDPGRHSLMAVPGFTGEALFPAIDLNGVPLWGFTYRLGTSWLGLLPQQDTLEQAGFEAANRILEFLLAHGLKLRSGWEERNAHLGKAEGSTVKVSSVEGLIPTDRVMAQFAMPGETIPQINLLEIKADHIRVVGLAFEEYLILASGE
jgi:8-oxo-dGTP pyrophosphatase MutT (NUDIX family)